MDKKAYGTTMNKQDRHGDLRGVCTAKIKYCVTAMHADSIYCGNHTLTRHSPGVRIEPNPALTVKVFTRATLC